MPQVELLRAATAAGTPASRGAQAAVVRASGERDRSGGPTTACAGAHARARGRPRRRGRVLDRVHAPALGSRPSGSRRVRPARADGTAPRGTGWIAGEAASVRDRVPGRTEGDEPRPALPAISRPAGDKPRSHGRRWGWRPKLADGLLGVSAPSARVGDARARLARSRHRGADPLRRRRADRRSSLRVKRPLGRQPPDTERRTDPHDARRCVDEASTSPPQEVATPDEGSPRRGTRVPSRRTVRPARP